MKTFKEFLTEVSKFNKIDWNNVHEHIKSSITEPKKGKLSVWHNNMLGANSNFGMIHDYIRGKINYYFLHDPYSSKEENENHVKQFHKDMEGIKHGLDNEFAQHSSIVTKPLTVYRMISGDYAKNLLNKENEHTFIEPSWVSTTPLIHHTARFTSDQINGMEGIPGATKTRSHNTLLQIKLKPGQKVLYPDYHKEKTSEGEIILPRGSQFTIKHIENWDPSKHSWQHHIRRFYRSRLPMTGASHAINLEVHTRNKDKKFV